MLVLSRRRDEEIVIGNEQVIFKIVEIRGDKVRIGIIAAPDISIHRSEVFDAIER